MAALHMAAQEGKIEVVRVLIKADKALVNIQKKVYIHLSLPSLPHMTEKGAIILPIKLLQMQ